MKFHEYSDIWSVCKKSGMAEERQWNTRDQMYSFLALHMSDQLSRRHLYFDQLWHHMQCPYYDVYPSIIPMLTKINLDLSGEYINETYLNNKAEADLLIANLNAQLSTTVGLAHWLQLDAQFNAYICTNSFLPHLLVRLPECDHALSFDDPVRGKTFVKTIFVSFQPVNMKFVAGYKGDTLIYGLTIGIDVGEKVSNNMGFNIPTYLINCIPLNGNSLESTMNLLPRHESAEEGVIVPNKIIIDCVKLCLTLRLIKDDPDLIEPDVMSKDRCRYDSADPVLKNMLIQKAIRRGKYAFKIGHLLESSNMSPHLRRPHPALVWTGEGRRVPKIVARKGSIVHRERVKQVPTGYKP